MEISVHLPSVFIFHICVSLLLFLLHSLPWSPQEASSKQALVHTDR